VNIFWTNKNAWYSFANISLLPATKQNLGSPFYF